MNKKIFGIFLLGVIFLLLGGCGSTVSSGLGASSTVTGAGDFVWSSVFLTSIDISTGTIDPSFSKETTTYTVQVPNTVDHVTVTPAAEDPYAQINLAGQTLISGEESNQINLVVGVPKTIEIKITSRTSTDEKTYTVIVTRIPSNDANLSGLTVNGAAITPTIFDKDTIIYSATVLSTTTSITLTPVLEDLTASLRVNTLSANSGDTVPVVLAAGLNIINTV
ncbi:MAG: cadherin-like beta sandwich domain-containing protein, partial [Proteobacteria bacterium]|nr:cadherin-like beta sandwich domain-containing protein [Pseudomonadota bacterium]